MRGCENGVKMEKKLQKLELTWIGKEKRPRLEPRVLVEDAAKSHHAATRRLDGKDIFDEESENGVYLCVINRNREARPYRADCSAAGLDFVSGIAVPTSGTILKLA